MDQPMNRWKEQFHCFRNEIFCPLLVMEEEKENYVWKFIFAPGQNIFQDEVTDIKRPVLCVIQTFFVRWSMLTEFSFFLLFYICLIKYS
jgi:hypothetical protein